MACRKQRRPIIHRRKFNPCMHWDSCLGIIYLFFDDGNAWRLASTLPKNNRSFHLPFSLGWAATTCWLSSVNIPNWSFFRGCVHLMPVWNDTDHIVIVCTVYRFQHGRWADGWRSEPSTKTNIILKTGDYQIINSVPMSVSLITVWALTLLIMINAYNQIHLMPSSITSGYSAKYINAGQHADNWGRN